MYNHIEKFFQDPKNEGYLLHAFTSGGRLRVLRIDSPNKDKKGLYGESINLNEAFKILEEDAQAGGRKYSDVYGPIHPHYLTGAYPEENDRLDCLLAEGYTFDITYKDGMFQMTVNYGRRNKTPKAIMEKVSATGKPVKFEIDNLEFECSLCRFANGDIGHSTACLTKIEQGFDPWYIKLKHIVESNTIESLLTKMVYELGVLDKEIAWNEI